ncbi:tRNA preQ1(34) S-adenosylmethionine ribosyltransferase-isomerase QueA [Oleiharenicola lentus]|uniref:S-adenosylmethionine:tRNA ribosyltransferase-isomerase n=1 Tax=Oleiharenicola lentus TaxID=2508720 RepID=A0A4Q1C371_9BACT|nr:tRNA preQ1(34) S-adenosylmethionine ribosyltransferase-isomerase QueA [Oleiharenicola lentus]RXK52770.1 tRNA preQ1(34) S-adenosylmethionine ribosyltransferase-isomerase QueA [Oleiharenicola lentus]
MNADLFDYSLPERLIAQQPAQRRDESRLLVVDRKNRSLAHRQFRDLPEYLRAGDTLFRNNAAVIPARLHAVRPTGGAVECLLLRPAVAPVQVSGFSASVSQSENRGQTPGGQQSATAKSQVSQEWWCLIRPGKKLPVGASFGLEHQFTGTVLEKTEDGLARVSFTTTDGDILAVANRIGEMPLPPYITGHESAEAHRLDRERYQTVYADRGHQVAAAAPTAGLHFTPELLAKVSALGVSCADLTLHVGLGTFRPITAERIEDHAIHREVYEMPVVTQRALFETKGRRIAVGTTSVRSIEDYLSRTNAPSTDAWMAEASIFIYPPRSFRGVDALITNFHQPRSTLLCLVSSFLTPGSMDGINWLKEIYAEAIAREYRFFSYGDAMLIL